MSFLASQVRRGAYCDSIVLMQLQSALKDLPGVLDSGAAMATETNLSLLRENALLPPRLDPGQQSSDPLSAEDLLVVVKAEDQAAATEALARVDELLARRSRAVAGEYRPKSLDAAVKSLPEARWVLVSVPGRYAARVAGDALDLGRHVFLYSDNVDLGDEVALKRKALAKGLLVMGPDCGTTIVGGVGLGFANRVRRGTIGLVGASGTGLQAITSRIHGLGHGVSHAFGTGGRDLHAEVGAATARQALDLLARDPGTEVIVIVSKPPSPLVASRLLSAARAAGKPVVVDFIGYAPPARRLGDVHFASSLGEAAALAVELAEASGGAGKTGDAGVAPTVGRTETAAAVGYLRGLFSGGTLAHEALQGLRALLDPLHSNVEVDGVLPLHDPARSRGHSIVDLGADELTVGRLHPMIDPEHCVRRLRQEGEDGETGLILLDVVLGDGAHPDPASELAPAIAEVRRRRELPVVAVVVGTDEDPQGLRDQIERLEAAGAVVFHDVADAVAYVAECLAPASGDEFAGVDAADLQAPVAAINVGLESFYDSLVAQGADAVHLEWRPPAGGNEKLMAILQKMRK
ncbi:MAG: acyl-CoA synthetase FdrA [Thermoanaerobaculia bacterium]